MYKDPEKQKENVRQSVARHKRKKKIEEYDSEKFLNGEEQTVDEALIKACEKGSPQALMTYFKRTGKIVEKKEETIRYEPSPDEYIGIAQRVIERLKDSCRETGGSCPICGFGKILDGQLCLDTEREHDEEGEVATVALLT